MKYFFILIFITTSCASIKWPSFNSDIEEENVLVDYEEFDNKDYLDHLRSFEKIYISTLKNDITEVKAESYKYLSTIIRKIELNNELFFKTKTMPKFYIVNDMTPFHFSLPGKKFFLSAGLIKKYIKNEVMLYCLLSFELVRSEKDIYHKEMIIPVGVLTTQQMISLTRISANDKVEVHKWAFYILKRVGIEPESYLAWLQVINRNSMDFALQLGDIHSISKEESMFKAFLIANEKRDQINRHHGSSREFYKFIKKIKG